MKANPILESIPLNCRLCKGACWYENDNFATQRKSIEMFGEIQNLCVVDELGNSRCPYRKN